MLQVLNAWECYEDVLAFSSAAFAARAFALAISFAHQSCMSWFTCIFFTLGSCSISSW